MIKVSKRTVDFYKTLNTYMGSPITDYVLLRMKSDCVEFLQWFIDRGYSDGNTDVTVNIIHTSANRIEVKWPKWFDDKHEDLKRLYDEEWRRVYGTE